MKKLILVRHGQPNHVQPNNGGLDPYHGVHQIEYLSKCISPLCKESSVRVYTEHAARIKETALVLTRCLGLPEAHDIGDLDHSPPKKIVEWLVQIGVQSDITILVTHAEVVWRVPREFCDQQFDERLYHLPDVQRGQAAYIDCENKTMCILGENASDWRWPE